MFKYSVDVCDLNGENAVLSVFQPLNNLDEVKITSKNFNSYTECFENAKAFVESLSQELNVHYQNADYVVESEANPNQGETSLLTGIGDLARWAPFEVLRFYVIDQSRDCEAVTKIRVTLISNIQFNPQ